MKKIERALISVSDKKGIIELAAALAEFGVEIISTGGTAKAIREAGLNVIDVSEVTGFPEILDGRVKTLHPKIHAAILAKSDAAEHLSTLTNHNIRKIDLVVVNLYPFRKTVADPAVTLQEAIENIDIGGPSMLRSAAKNYQDVTVVVDPDDYDSLIKEMREKDGAISHASRQKFAARAFAHTARYDLAIAAYLSKVAGVEPAEFGKVEEGKMPQEMVIVLERIQDLRYGENPHQSAALYQDSLRPAPAIAKMEQLQGKELSYNNLVDADAAWQLVSEFEKLTCAIIKHTNPCGVGLGKDPREAYLNALSTDPVSAFGGIIAFNKMVDLQAAEAISQLFAELVIAPSFSKEALELLKNKKNLRLIINRDKKDEKRAETTTRSVMGGYLKQTEDKAETRDLKVVTKREPTEAEWRDLDFAWKICKHVKSNAIVYAANGKLLGVGAGQMSRLDSVKLAASKAQLPLTESVMASDAFFPFRDGIDEAAKQKIRAVIQPGGSIKDKEVIEAADEHGLAMVFTGIRHFRH